MSKRRIGALIAIEREVGLPTARVDAAYLQRCLSQVTELLRSQRKFHESTSDRCHRIEQRLHPAGISLLVLTLAACVLHVLPNFVSNLEVPHRLPWILTFLCGVLPALGAALAGISTQGEFRRVEKRSLAMVTQLDQLLEESRSLERAMAGPTDALDCISSRQVRSLASKSAQLMVNEVLDWRVVFLDRPIVEPT
jgi:hypothetical protein